jgi:hypothetical protein
MADQASVRSRAGGPVRGNGHEEGIVEEVTGLGNDIATLLELQAKLAALDAKETTRKALVPVAAICVSIVLTVSAFTVGLFGAADVLARAFSWERGSAPALLITALIALVIAGATIVVSSLALKSSVAPFRRSAEEFVRNLAWLRTVFVYGGRAVPRRG